MQLRCPTRARTPESSPRSAPGIPATQAACNTRRASPLLYTYPTSGGGGGWKAGPRQRGSWLGCSPRHRKCAALRIGAWRPATTAGSRPRPVPADCQDIEHQAIASPCSIAESTSIGSATASSTGDSLASGCGCSRSIAQQRTRPTDRHGKHTDLIHASAFHVMTEDSTNLPSAELTAVKRGADSSQAPDKNAGHAGPLQQQRTFGDKPALALPSSRSSEEVSRHSRQRSSRWLSQDGTYSIPWPKAR